MRVLLLPDAHVQPGQDLSRFARLGRLILDRRVDVVCQLGDFVSMESLSHWNEAKRLTMEGQRYRADVDAGNQALDLLLQPLLEHNQRQRRLKMAQYRPEWIWLLGNHEDWCAQYVEKNPQMAGFVDIARDLRLRERGMTVIPYRESHQIEGVIFSHSPINAAGKPCSGKHALLRSSELSHRSTVFGHTHRWEALNVMRHGAETISQFLSAGMFAAGVDAYAHGTPCNWWRGVTILEIWAPGRFDAEQVSLERLMK